MKWAMAFFSLSLRLYPRPFRERFAEEMETVFRTGLEEAREQGKVVQFLLGEILRLPVSLADVYFWSMRAGESRQVAMDSASGGSMPGPATPGRGWGDALLAGLPNLLFGIILVSGKLLADAKSVNQIIFSRVMLLVLGLLLMGVLIYSTSKGWRRWSSSWLTYLFIIIMSLLSLALSALLPSATQSGLIYSFQIACGPLILAYLLYKMACVDRLRGLLAALPLTAIVWGFFEERVPNLPMALAWAWLFGLAFAAAVLMIRTRRFPLALGLALAVPLLGGFPFAFLGVYQGGTLPFSEPGPSVLEVFRQYLPFVAMVMSITLGPQLAIKFRSIGYESAGAGGKIAYRLTLGGVLLGLAVALLQFGIMIGSVQQFIDVLTVVVVVLLIAAAALYLAGFALLVWAAIRSGALSGDSGAALRMAALFILLPGIPVALVLAIPNPAIGNAGVGWLFSAAEIAWAAAAAWLVKD